MNKYKLTFLNGQYIQEYIASGYDIGQVATQFLWSYGTLIKIEVCGTTNPTVEL